MIYEILIYTIFLTTILYVFIGIFIHLGLSKKYNRISHKPKVTVLVAARNEETNLPDCLKSLGRQDYPQELLQIIAINDRSTDATREIILQHTDQIPILQLVEISEDLNDLKGKMNALAQGMNHAEGEIVLITDADCRVPQNWVSEMVSYFAEEIGLVGSLTTVSASNATSKFFDHIQKLDWFFLQAIASGTTGINLPVSVLGNNFGFRKSIYDMIGGFASIGFSLTEDMALLRAILNKTTYKIAYPLEKKSMIQTLPLNNYLEFYRQRKRWLSGGLKAPLWGWILISSSFIAHLLILVNLILLNVTFPVIIGLIFLTGIDFSLIWRLLNRSESKKLMKYFIPYEIFYYFYTLILAVSVILPGKIYWKGQSFNKT